MNGPAQQQSQQQSSQFAYKKMPANSSNVIPQGSGFESESGLSGGSINFYGGNGNQGPSNSSMLPQQIYGYTQIQPQTAQGIRINTKSPGRSNGP